MALTREESMPRRLNIESGVERLRDTTQLWRFVRQLKTREHPLSITCELEIVWFGKPNLFTWSGGDRDVVRAAFVGQLLPEAARLYEKNIKMIDSHRLDYRTMSDYKVKPRA